MSTAELLLRLGVAVVAMSIVGTIGLAGSWVFVAGAAFADSGPGRWIAATVAVVIIAATLALVLGVGYLAVTLQVDVAPPALPPR